jgi:signal transduction histidine kinase
MMSVPSISKSSSAGPFGEPSGKEESLRHLLEIGLNLASARSLEQIAKCTLEGAVSVCGGQFGLFHYYEHADDGEIHQRCTFVGMNAAMAREVVTLVELPEILSRQSVMDEKPSRTRGLRRMADVQVLDDQGIVAREVQIPFRGLPPMRSYLAAPVRSHDDELLGVLICGHERPNSFGPECEEFVATVGSQAAVAMENVRLNRNMAREISIANEARKLQEQTLRESEKLAATGRLAATVAHEINNPLEAVTNLIYLARTDREMPTHVQQLLDTADSELARVSQLAQQTLGFYRDTTRLVSMDLNKLLLDTVDLFTRKMRNKNVACTVDLEPNLVLFGLQGEIRQVFSNLLVNAIDASSRSTIHIRARHRCQRGVEGVAVVIADHGSGIPATVRQQLFTPFVTTKESVGTGLGLWVTRGIVEKQGGSVRFRTSTVAPRGTAFRTFLPLRPPSL